MERIKDLIKLPDGVKSDRNFDITTEEGKKEYCQYKCDIYNETVGSLNERDGYDCPICKNKGFIAVPAKADYGNGYWYEENQFCKCYKVRSTIMRLKKSGLKNIIKDYTFKNFVADTEWQKAIKEAAIRFVQDADHSWFFIGGTSGCGKSHICTAIAGYYLKHDKAVKYMLWRDDVVKLKANVTDAVEYSRLMEGLKKSEVLYIDDLFKTGKDADGNPQRPTPADINIAFEVLNYRYNNPKLITIVSSECMLTDILDIDEAVGGRIAEMTTPHGYGFSIKPDRAKNYRLRGAVEL